MKHWISAIRSDKHVRWLRPGLLAGMGFALLAVLGLLPLSEFALHALVLSLIFAMLAASWDLLIGYAGQLSFGHAAFLAVGGYASALLNGELGISPWLGLPLGGVAAIGVGIVFGLPALRVRGPYLALTTLALAKTVEVVIENWTGLTRGHMGYGGYESFPGVPFSRINYYYLALALCAVSLTSLYILVQHTRIGLAWRALRDDELRARTLGLNITAYKLAAFVVSAFIAGMAGSFFAHYTRLVTPTLAELDKTAMIVAMAVLGGRGTIFGSVIGALIVENLAQHLRALGVVYNDIGTGVLILALIGLAPDGILGLVRRTLLHRRKTQLEQEISDAEQTLQERHDRSEPGAG